MGNSSVHIPDHREYTCVLMNCYCKTEHQHCHLQSFTCSTILFKLAEQPVSQGFDSRRVQQMHFDYVAVFQQNFVLSETHDIGNQSCMEQTKCAACSASAPT